MHVLVSSNYFTQALNVSYMHSLYLTLILNFFSDSYLILELIYWEFLSSRLSFSLLCSVFVSVGSSDYEGAVNVKTQMIGQSLRPSTLHCKVDLSRCLFEGLLEIWIPKEREREEEK